MADRRANLVTRLFDANKAPGVSDTTVFVSGDETCTRGQLADRVKRIANVLKTLRIHRGERAVILMPDGIDCAATILGCIYAGVIAVPVSDLAVADDLHKLLTNCEASVAFVHHDLEDKIEELRARLPSLREVLSTKPSSPGVRDLHAAIRSSAPASKAAAVNPRDPAFILFPGVGVRPGIPAGVVHCHEMALRSHESFGTGLLKLAASDRILCLSRLYTNYGLSLSLFFPLLSLGQAVFVPEQPTSDRLFQVIQDFDPTVFAATPSVYSQMAHDAESHQIPLVLENTRVCVSGSESVPPKLLPRIKDILGADVIVGYGLTESFQFTFAGDGASIPASSCGTTLPQVEAEIVDDHGTVVEADEIGTLRLRGPTLFTGYWGQEESSIEADGWFVTKDRFLRDSAGFYYHCGRVDELFKVGGKWISPLEVERVLLAHEAVWECAVIGVDDEDGFTKPLAFVVPNIGHAASEMLEQDLRKYVKASLAPYKYPRWIEFRDVLPKGPSGKILRYKLRTSRRRRRAETQGELT